MTIHTPADLKDYFQGIATALGCDFAYGNSEKILNRQSSNLRYPVLWLEIPEIRLQRDGGLKREFASAFLILSDAPVDDFDAQDTRLDETFLLTEQVLQMLQSGSEDEYPAPYDFDMENSKSEHKPKWSADDDWGWRTEFTLMGAACEDLDCCDGDDTISLPATPGNLIHAPGGTISVGAKKLVYAIVILPTDADNTVKIGTTPGGDEVMSEEIIEAGRAWTDNGQHFFQAAGSLYFTVTEDCTAIVYTR